MSRPWVRKPIKQAEAEPEVFTNSQEFSDPWKTTEEPPKKEKKEEKAETEENAKIVKENCEIYKQNLSALKNSPRIREKDAKGEYRYLTEEEKAERTKGAETYIQENCK